MNLSVKNMDVADMFYPRDTENLNKMLDCYINESPEIDIFPKAIVVPHAGFIYSGRVAATGYKTLRKMSKNIENIIILSPAHRYYFEGLAYHCAKNFETPYGNLEVNSEKIELVKDLNIVNNIDAAFNLEHGLETHLPFIKKILPEVKIVPFIVGPCRLEDVVLIIERLIDEKTVLIVSSDLSHFHDYDTCNKIDKQTCFLIEKLKYDRLESDFACGYYPLKGMLRFAEKNNLKCKNVELKNSGDSSGDKEKVVGYGSFVIY
jgi:MEMO1 family protein